MAAISEYMFVLASQGFALFVFGLLPNLRLSLSVCALLGILSFSIAAFSHSPKSRCTLPWPSSAGSCPCATTSSSTSARCSTAIRCTISRVWYAAYIVYMILSFTMLWRMKKEMLKPVYVP